MPKVKMNENSRARPMAGERGMRTYGDIKRFKKGKEYYISASLWRMWRSTGIADLIIEEPEENIRNMGSPNHRYKWNN